MAVMQHKREILSRGEGVVEKDTRVVTEDDASPVVEPGVNVAARVIYFITSVIVGLLLIRFVLSLLGANRANAFADFIYTTSQPFAAPFFGLFNYQAQYGVSRFEFETLVAALVYVLLAWMLIGLLDLGRRRSNV